MNAKQMITNGNTDEIQIFLTSSSSFMSNKNQFKSLTLVKSTILVEL